MLGHTRWCKFTSIPNRQHTLPAILVVATPIPLYFSVTATKGIRPSSSTAAFKGAPATPPAWSAACGAALVPAWPSRARPPRGLRSPLTVGVVREGLVWSAAPSLGPAPSALAPPPHLSTRRRRLRRARRGPKMAACGRVRRMFRLSAALQLLLLLGAAGAQKLPGQAGHGQGQGPAPNFGPVAGQAGGGGPAGQPLLQLQPQQQQQQQPQQQQQQQQQPPQPPQPPFPAGGPPARRGGAGPGGAGGGWKLAEEEFCREDVTRVCPKHTWSNNLAVLECLQDVREVRRRSRAGRARPGAGRWVSPARGAADAGPLLRSPLRCARAFPPSPSPGAFREAGSSPTRSLPARGRGTPTPARRAATVGGGPERVCVWSGLLCDALRAVAPRGRPVLGFAFRLDLTICSNPPFTRKWLALLRCSRMGCLLPEGSVCLGHLGSV